VTLNPVPPLRRSTRVRVRIPVTVMGILPNGATFAEQTCVVSVSKFGAELMTGYPLEPGMEVRLRSKARTDEALFQVVWAGREGTLRTGKVGIQYVAVSNFLGVTFPD
jgi:hypothetical protein